jgi:hydroxypyruvate isomerase
MERREFLKTSLAAGATVIAASNASVAEPAAAAQDKAKFKLKYGPHPGMFRNHAPGGYTDELKFAADQGFEAWEDNGMRGRPKEEQEKLAKEMQRLGIQMGIFVANDDGLSKPILASGDQGMREKFLANIRETVEVAKRVNTKHVTLVIGTEAHRLPFGYQFANIVESLKRASALCEPSGLILVAEPLNIYRDHPEFFGSSVHRMYAIMKAVNSPSCKILFDIYHTQINEGNLIPNFDRSYDEVAYIQTGDTPGRNEPGTGEINYRNVFRHIHNKGYKGILGMEHGISKPGKEGELALIQAYRECDSF